jgi:hypothetical protein
MAIVTVYDHTRSRYLSGANAVGDTYKINLYTALPENITATTKAAAETGATQLATANGYVQNDKVLTGLAVTIDTFYGRLEADDVIWTATGGSISAGFALIYNDTDASDPPVIRIDFDGTVTALDTDPFQIVWDPAGIIRLA